MILAILMGATLSMAQEGPNPETGEKQPSFEEFLRHKTDYIVTEMKLDDATAQKFRPLYEELQKAKGALFQKYGNAFRDLRREMKKTNGQVSDELYLRTVKNEAQLNFEDAQLERDYLNKFEMVLTPKQLYEYVKAEKHFKAQFWNKGKQGNGKKGQSTRKGESKRN
jgi:Spy/CpxP family protein refolding chaperone